MSYAKQLLDTYPRDFLIGANGRGYSRSPNEWRRCASRARVSAAEAP
jgi:hypothetical protein